MLCCRYKDSCEFVIQNCSRHPLVRLGFVRQSSGLISALSFSWLRVALASLPIVGSILGLSRLYSVWSTNHAKDSKVRYVGHTLIGIVESVGLGGIFLVALITLILLQIVFVLLTIWVISPLYHIILKGMNRCLPQSKN